MMNRWALAYRKTNGFGCFHGVVDQVVLVKDKLSNLTKLLVNLCSFQITHGVKSYTMNQR